MDKQPVQTKKDRQALNNLTQYNQQVIQSINSELASGIVAGIGKSIDEGTLNTFTDNLFETQNNKLPYILGDDGIIDNPQRFSVDTRCVFTAKTEYARAVNTGLLQSYTNYGVKKYELITSGLPTVCNKCLEYESHNPYTLDEITSILPVHVNCVCSVKGVLPVNMSLQSNTPVIDLTPNKK